MAVLDLTLMDIPARKGDRVAWADIAKAFSMILLVAYTLFDHRVYINEMLIFLRMPLFFFVSGLFGYRVVTATSLPRADARQGDELHLPLPALGVHHLPLHPRRVPLRPGLSPARWRCGC